MKTRKWMECKIIIGHHNNFVYFLDEVDIENGLRGNRHDMKHGWSEYSSNRISRMSAHPDCTTEYNMIDGVVIIRRKIQADAK